MIRSTKSGVTGDEVDLVGQPVAGLDRGDVRVDEDRADALLLAAP